MGRPEKIRLGEILLQQKLLTEGYLSLQAESHPVQFRKIEIKRLPTDAAE